MQTPALVDLRRRNFIVIKFSRTVPHALLAYKQLTELRQVHAMFVISSAFESNHIADMSPQSF